MIFLQNPRVLLPDLDCHGMPYPTEAPAVSRYSRESRLPRTDCWPNFQTVNLLGNPLFHLFGGFELLELLLIIFNLGPGIVLAEFLADDFKLLAQNIITLVLIDPLFDFP